MTSHTSTDYDAVIVGGGHNGLTAGAYLARHGRRVLLLERLDVLGGAAISAEAFDGFDARLSRYSYLVSLLPQQIIDDLGLEITLLRRRYSSYTPVPGHPDGIGLLVDLEDQDATAASFAAIGAGDDLDAFTGFYRDTEAIARVLWPTVTEPLLTRSDVRERLNDDRLWAEFFERPIGESITSRLRDDIVRGVVATDALIGTFADLDEDSLQQNKCLLYHVIGGGTGDWDIPVGGMGSVSGALARAAREAGVEIRLGAEVTSIGADGSVEFTVDGAPHHVVGDVVLANVTPAVLNRLTGEDTTPPVQPEGAQVKVNLLLSRLPKLKDSTIDPAVAFGGTFHINEAYTQLGDGYRVAASGEVPDLLPCEIYCHSLTDRSILGEELAASGAQTLTVFGLHAPDRWITEENNDERRARLQQSVIDSLNSVLAEPIEDVVLTDAAGRPCIETKTTLDLEHALGMTGGNIFHGPLSWPFLEDEDARDTPAQRWGVATAFPRVLLCGAGAQRGGAVSGLGGHNAAKAALETWQLAEAAAPRNVAVA